MDEKYIYISVGANRFYTNDIQTVKEIVRKNDDKLYEDKNFLEPSSKDIEI